ncbi:MAG: hypothetical protein GY941_08935 [Planctomycetes bacterium]|nr:hypothetical protein [Planctomycetota bacterium]
MFRQKTTWYFIEFNFWTNQFYLLDKVSVRAELQVQVQLELYLSDW